MKTIVTHANCSDGMMSAIILHNHMPTADVVFCQYGAQLEQLPATPGMLFCDFAPPANRVKEFVDAGAVVLDHHVGAKDVVAQFGENGVYADQPGFSGAVLAMQYANVDPESVLGRMAMAVGIRDTWQRQHPQWEDACNLCEALSFLPYTFWKAQQDNLQDPNFWAHQIMLGAQLRQKRLADAGRALLKALVFVSRKGTRAAVFEGTHLTSDAADLDADLDVIIGFHYAGVQDGKLQLIFSTRTRGSRFSPLAFCKYHGGGGHEKAAGFTKQLDPRHAHADPYTLVSCALRDYEEHHTAR